MKKFLSLVLAAIMLLTIMPTAFAASTPTITVKADKTTISKGTVVTFTVSVSSNSNLVALTHKITYDTSEFEYVDNSAIVSDSCPYAMVNGNNPGKIAFAATVSDDAFNSSAHTLYTFKLRAKGNTGTILPSVTEAYVYPEVNVTSAVNAASDSPISFAQASNYIVIRQPSRTSISYADSIVLHADFKKTPPSKSRIEWSTDNKNFKTTASEDGKTFKITSSSSGSTTVTATLYSSSGSVIESASIQMTSKASFFNIIIGFFRSLFGLTNVYDAN